MKQIILLSFLFPLFCNSQEQQNKKITLDYIGGYYTNFSDWRENGFNGGIEFSYNKNSITYSANLLVGFGLSKNLNTKNGYFQAFLESDLLIGKKMKLSNTISFIPQIGIGYLHLTNHFQEEKKYLIGLPIQTKILFSNNKITSFGIIPKVILNNTQNNYSINFTVNIKL